MFVWMVDGLKADFGVSIHIFHYSPSYDVISGLLEV